MHQLVLEPLQRLSFSRYARLRRCKLSGAVIGGPHTGHAPGFTRFQALGEVLHTLMQRVNETPEGSARDAAYWRKAFNEVVQSLSQRIAASPSSRHLGDPLRWPELTGIYRRVMSVVERRDHGGETPLVTHAEAEIRSRDGLLFGRIDAYFEYRSGIELVDYKSGAAREGDTAKPDYEDQLYFYAYLIEDRHGHYPKALRLVGSEGKETSVLPDRRRSHALAAEMRAALLKYNASVAERVAPERLATPSSAACGFCDRKAACVPFWQTMSSIELPAWSHVALGVPVGPTVRSRLGGASFELSIERSSLGVGRLKICRVFEHRFPGVDLDRMTGHKVVVTGLRRPNERAAPDVAELTDQSAILVLEPPA